MDIDQLFSFGNKGASRKDEAQEKSTHHEIFQFYSMALGLGVYILPLVWNPSLEQLGEGATGRISQSPLNKTESLAFKRFSPWRIQSRLSKEKFRPLQYQSMISEIAALQGLPLNHRNIVNLKGLSWEIVNDKEVLPVLVFKKAEFGDLGNFLSLPEAADLTIEDRMAICGEVCRALLTMHEHGIIHGDIKPGNILIFKAPQDDPDSFHCKVTDFGYSCLGSKDDDLVSLPRTIPWEAPEWHPREFTLNHAKKADMYSFGLLCLWLIFHEDTLPNGTMPNLSIGKAFSGQYRLENSALAILKENGSLLDSVLHVVSSKPGLSTSARSTLGEVFKLSLQHNASDRVSKMDPFVELLSIRHDYGPPSDVEAITVVPKWHESFKVESCYYDLEACDFRVGRFIAEQLIDAAKRKDEDGCKDCSCNAAFQAAICYSFGFGVHIDHEACDLYLKQSCKSRNDLEAVIQRIRDGRFNVRAIESLVAEGYRTPLAIDYANEGIEDEAILEYTAMIQARERVLGTGHLSTRRARSILANIYNKTGQYQAALLLKEKELELCYEQTAPDRFTKQNILVLKNSLAEDYEQTGRVGESENFRLDVLHSCSQGADGSSQDPRDVIPMYRLLRLEALCGLSSISFTQGEYKMAVDRGNIALRECEDFLGPDHSLTLMAKFGLGKALWEIGEQTEATQTVQELVYARERLLGASHTDTVTTADKLCLMYVELRKVNEAEEVFLQFIQPTIFNLSTLKKSSVGIGRQYACALADVGQMDRARCIQEHRLAVYMQQLGASHQNTIVMMIDLAITYQKQFNWKRAEPLQRDVIEWMDKRNGPDHPQTLAAMRNLSDTLFNQGKWHEAAELSLKELHIRQAKSPDIDMENIVAIDKVTRALVKQEKWGDALKNLVQEVEWRLLGTPVEKPALDETAVQESIGFAALSALHSGAYDMARKYLAVFFKRVLANTLVPVGIQTVLAVLDPLARICERVEWLEEAEQLLILDILIRTKHLGSGDNSTIVDERGFRAVKLCQRQGKALDQGIFNPNAIIERGERVI